MPHLFANRPRLHGLMADSRALNVQFRWETINAVIYKIGGLMFIIGSVLFFPRFAAYLNVGAWTFFFGSLLYLIVTGHDLAEALRYRRRQAVPSPQDNLELTAAVSYVVGTILFTFGSIFFLSEVGWGIAGAWCFVVGSLLFVLGAGVNVLQIVQARALITLQLMNLTAISFIVGAVLFTVASVPYLWSVANAADRVTLYQFLALQYLIGSVLFFLGGVFNYWRAYIVINEAINAEKAAHPTAPAGT